MKSLKQYLVVLLFVQMLVTAGLYWRGNEQQEVTPTPLLGLDLKQLTRIRIESSGADADSLVLERQDGHWRLPDGLPVNDERLQAQVMHLLSLQSSWPVATTRASHERFRVDDSHFERRLTLTAGGQQSVLLLGSAPSMGHIHGRLGTSDEVYSLPLNAFDWPLKESDWVDKKLLALAGVGSISSGSLTLQQQGDGWQLVTPVLAAGDSRQLDESKVKAFVEALAALQVNGIATADEAALFRTADQVQNWQLRADQDYHYRLWSDGKQAYIGRADYQQNGQWQVFRLPLALYQQWQGMAATDELLIPVLGSTAEEGGNQASGRQP